MIRPPVPLAAEHCAPAHPARRLTQVVRRDKISSLAWQKWLSHVSSLRPPASTSSPGHSRNRFVQPRPAAKHKHSQHRTTKHVQTAGNPPATALLIASLGGLSPKLSASIHHSTTSFANCVSCHMPESGPRIHETSLSARKSYRRCFYPLSCISSFRSHSSVCSRAIALRTRHAHRSKIKPATLPLTSQQFSLDSLLSPPDISNL